MCFDGEKSNFSAHTEGVDMARREGGSRPGWREEVGMRCGLLLAVGTQGPAEVGGKMGERISWVGKGGRLGIHDLMKYRCGEGSSWHTQGRPHVMGWAARGTGTGSPVSAFSPLKKMFPTQFYLFFSLCCLHGQGWLLFLPI